MASYTFYVLHGEDEYSLKAQITQLQQAMNDPSRLNTSDLDGTAVSAMAAINAVSAFPFLSDKRLVIIHGMLAGKKAKADLEVLCEELPKLPDFARLVFHEEKALPESHVVVKLARETATGFEKQFALPKDAAPWIMKQAKAQHGLEIEHAAAYALASVVENNLRAADSELAKLAAYVNYERSIRESDVAEMTSYVAEADVFEMVDAIGQQNGKLALRLAQNLMEKNNDPLSLLGMINRQFRLLVLARENLDNPSQGPMAAALGVSEFVARKVGPQAKRFANIEQLEEIYRKLADLDFRIKTGRIEAEMAVQLFIAGVTE
jgi:DNA polymerase III subunit delta